MHIKPTSANVLSIVPSDPECFDLSEHLAIQHAVELMQIKSITPVDGGCQTYLADKLAALGFDILHLPDHGVSNLIARIGRGDTHIGFSGHTDVVPPGDINRWRTSPFVPHIQDGNLYGRGAADMKTGVAAMLAACETFDWQRLDSQYSFWWLITSDEEGEAEFGSQSIKHYLDHAGVQLDRLIVGEPTAAGQTGDAIKVGRRGSLSASVKIRGKQGHVAYPQQALNAAHIAARIVSALENLHFDAGSIDFPGTTLQVTQIDTGSYSDNIVPGQCQISFNVRYASDYTESQLKAMITNLIEDIAFEYELEWQRPCVAYLSQPRTHGDCLIHDSEQAIHAITGRYPVLSTAGGTSDGRFFANAQTQVVELGVPNRTIHQVNEHVALDDIRTLQAIFAQLLKRSLQAQ